jgi:predicted nucleotidyltransferase
MENIKKILKEIEQKKNIEILYACETGSRAWGFPSPDSDYDVRLLYRHDLDWYLSLAQRKDSIEIMDGDLDVTGWDLRKCLHLLKKSNVPLIERFQSPIVYYGEEKFIAAFKELIRAYYSPVAVFYHHYSLASKFREDLSGEKEIKLKSYFYLIRSLLSCNWIVRSDEVLPMHIEGLMELVDAGTRKELRALINLKATVGEKYLHPFSNEMKRTMTGLFDFVSEQKDNLTVNKMDYSQLDKFFKDVIQ